MATEADTTPAGSEQPKESSTPPKEWEDRVRASIMDVLEDSPAGAPEKPEQPEDEPEAEVEPEADAEAPDETSEEAPSSWSLEDQDDYAAYQALRKAQWPHTLIEQLGRDELRMRGEKAAKMFAEVDRKLSAKGQTNETDGDKDAEPDKGPTHPVVSETISQSVRTIVESLGLEENEAQGLTLGIRGVVESAVKPFAEQLATVVSQFESIMVGSVVRDLEAEYPDLKSAEFRQKVAERAARLGKAGEAADMVGQDRMRELFRLAIRLENPDMPSKSEKQRQQKRDHWRKHGVPNGTTAKSKPPAPKNDIDRLIGIMDAVEQNVPETEIMARYGARR